MLFFFLAIFIPQPHGYVLRPDYDIEILVSTDRVSFQIQRNVIHYSRITVAAYENFSPQEIKWFGKIKIMSVDVEEYISITPHSEGNIVMIYQSASRSIIHQSRRLRQVIDLRDPDKSRYFAINEFNNCFIIRLLSMFSYLQSAICHFHGKTVVTITHEQKAIRFV